MSHDYSGQPFEEGNIEDVLVVFLRKHVDQRGHLMELIRSDWLRNAGIEIRPEMAYFSLSHPGTVRGPHEHVHQWDIFSFIGPGDFEVRLWDYRLGSSSHWKAMRLFVGENNPATIVVPPGVVHGYKALSTYPGAVLNFPNKLYKGEGYAEEVDEIRWEDKEGYPFTFDEVPPWASKIVEVEVDGRG